MTIVRNHILVILGSLFLLAAVFAAVFLTQPLLFFVPAAAAAVLLSVQHPRFLFYTLLFTIPWSVETTFANGLGTDLPDEPLMLLMAVVVMALLLADAGKRTIKGKLHPLLWILFAGLAWAAVTVVASTFFSLSVKYLLAKGWYVLAFAMAPLVLKGDEKLVKEAAIILFVSSFLVTCTGLVKHALLGFTFATINEAIAPFFRNHVNYSALLVFMVPLQVAFFKLTRPSRLRAVIVVSIVIVLAALYLSYARGAWLALIAGLLSYWWLKKGWLLKSFVLFLFLTASLVFWLQQNNRYLQFSPHYDSTVFHQDFSDHLLATYRGKDVSTAERFYRWVAGARMSAERWETGFGPTTFYKQYKSYTVPAFRTWVSDNKEQSTVHNYFLLLLVEQGIAGLLFFLLLVGALFWYAQTIYRRTGSPFWKTTVAAIAAILWMQCTLNSLSDLVETDKVGSVFYLCLAFLVIADMKTKGNSESRVS